LEELVSENIIYNGDCLDLFPLIRDKSQHLVLADPPYRVFKDFGNDSDKMSHNEYLKFCTSWIDECVDKIVDVGTLMIYGLTRLNWFMWGHLGRKAEKPERQLKELVWYYTNKQVPGINFYQPSHENIIVYLKDKDKRIFNKDEIRQPYETDYAKFAGKSRPPKSSRFGNKASIYKVHEKGAAPRDVLGIDEEIIPSILDGGILKTGTLAGGSGRERAVDINGNKHLTQKPIRLTRWLVLGSTNPGDNILIPFSGSGTEALVSYQEGRKFIGFELNEDFIGMTRMRFAKMNISTIYEKRDGIKALRIRS
jgi:site-specific DNA-methyltransferase (adenine-specific)